MAEVEVHDDWPKLPYLELSINKLKKTDIVQAYFHLESPQVPESTMFLPDTRGGGFVVIVKVWDNGGDSPHIFYKKDAWERLIKATKKWKVDRKEIAGLAYACQIDFGKDEILVLKIPNELEGFLSDLMVGWGTNKEEFRCGTHWN